MYSQSLFTIKPMVRKSPYLKVVNRPFTPKISQQHRSLSRMCSTVEPKVAETESISIKEPTPIKLKQEKELAPTENGKAKDQIDMNKVW